MVTLLVDGNNLAMRAIHAMAKSTLSADGILTGPLLIFVNTLSKHVREERPDRVVVCWDAGPSMHRVALYPEYKAHRQAGFDPELDDVKHSAFGQMNRFLSLAGIHHVSRPGFEADDLIADYVWRREGPVVILSSDKDFLQMLQPGVEQVRLSSGGVPTDRWAADRVREVYGCDPEQLPLAMALAGDESDGIPGVPRFGMKTAIKTLRKHAWDLEAVDHPAVVEHRDQVRVSLALVDLLTPRSDVQLGIVPVFRPTRPGDALFESLLSFLDVYQLDSIKRRVYDQSLWEETTNGEV